MAVAVVIPTCNRPNSLKRMLLSIIAGNIIPDEIIVVDQSKTNETEKIVNELQILNPFIKYKRDSGTGTSRSKNIGWSNVSSEYICFTDDDAMVDRYWLENLLIVIKDNVSCGVVGGKIEVPNINECLPLVYPQDKMYLLPYLDFGPDVKPFQEGSYPVGVNMITRRDLLVSLNGFNEDIGPNYSKKLQISGEETDYCQRVRLLGFSLFYAGNAIVMHPLTHERNTTKALKKRLEMEIYTHAVFNLNMEPFYLYFFKTILPLFKIIIRKIKRKKYSKLDNYLLWIELRSYLIAFFFAPRSIKRMRKKNKILMC